MGNTADLCDDLRAALQSLRDNLDKTYQLESDLRRGAKMNEAMHDWEDAWEATHELAEEILEKSGDDDGR